MKKNGELYVFGDKYNSRVDTTALLPKEAAAVGMSYGQFLDKIIGFSQR